MYSVPTSPAPMGSIIDSHAHYNDPAFDDFRDELLLKMNELGVGKIINCGCDFEAIDDCLALSRRYDFCYTATAFHPQNVPDYDIDFARMDRIIKSEPKVVAVGETGLDYYWKTDNKERQKIAFHEHLNLAKENDLPVIIHSRDACADSLEILKEHKPRGVVHCFSGSVETAREVMKLGMYIGVGGVLTFKNAVRLKQVVHEVPLERILLETDAPYMAPEPFRGTVNHSALIIYVAEKLAEIKNIPVSKVIETTTANCKELFGF